MPRVRPIPIENVWAGLVFYVFLTEHTVKFEDLDTGSGSIRTKDNYFFLRKGVSEQRGARTSGSNERSSVHFAAQRGWRDLRPSLTGLPRGGVRALSQMKSHGRRVPRGAYTARTPLFPPNLHRVPSACPCLGIESGVGSTRLRVHT